MWGLKFVRFRRYDALSRVPWQGFEYLIAEHYRSKGYRVEHSGTGANRRPFDGGIDLKLYRDGEYVVVQCKHWNTRQVPHNDVHQLIGVMHTQRAHRAIFVTSGEFTRAAWKAAATVPPLQMIDGDAVRAMLAPDEPSFAYQGPSGRRREHPPRWTAGHNGAGRYIYPWMVHVALKLLVFPLFMLLLYFVWMAIVRDSLAGLMPHPAPAPPSAYPAPHPNQNLPSQSYSSRARTQPAVGAPAPVYQATPMTDSELKDWKRRNAEAMKIIEKTTPEI